MRPSSDPTPAPFVTRMVKTTAAVRLERESFVGKRASPLLDEVPIDCPEMIVVVVATAIMLNDDFIKL